MSAEKPAASQTVSALLFGLAAGGAPGVPWEFRPRGSFHCRSMTGYGTHNQPPGTWSDGTSLTLCPAGSLSRSFSLGDIARNFIKWHGEAAFTAHGAVFDIGISAAEAVRRLKEGAAPEKAGCAGADENGNGSLMRTAPPAFFPAGKPEAERFEITRAISSVTHVRPWSAAACFIYLEYLLKLPGGMEKQAAYAELRGGFKGGSPAIGPDTPAGFSRILRADISALPESAVRSGGFVIHTLAAFWCFLTADNYRGAVLKAVNPGDDTGAAAVVTGALAGTAYGLDAIPAEWIETLAGAGEIRRIAGAPAAAYTE